MEQIMSLWRFRRKSIAWHNVSVFDFVRFAKCKQIRLD